MTADGKVDVEQSEWNLVQRPAKYRGRHGSSLGSDSASGRADNSAGSAGRSAGQEEPEGGLLIVLATLVSIVGKISAEAAVASGASMRVAYTLDSITTVCLWNEAGRMLGIPPDSVSGFETMVDKQVVESDWDDLAAQAGEPVDLEAWDAFLATHPMLQPPPV